MGGGILYPPLFHWGAWPPPPFPTPLLFSISYPRRHNMGLFSISYPRRHILYLSLCSSVDQQVTRSRPTEIVVGHGNVIVSETKVIDRGLCYSTYLRSLLVSAMRRIEEPPPPARPNLATPLLIHVTFLPVICSTYRRPSTMQSSAINLIAGVVHP